MKKILSRAEAAEKIRRYCAYQERSHQEVRKKLQEFGLKSNENEELITELITSGFLNEERFAKAFAGGKFRMKKWGKIKITIALESHGLSTNCIRSGLAEIPADDYRNTLQSILEKKNRELAEMEDMFSRRDALSKFAIRKGYEPDLVWNLLREFLPDQR